MTTLLAGTRESLLTPGLIVWDLDHPEDPEVDTLRRGGLVITVSTIGDELTATTITDGSADFRDRARAGLRVDQLPYRRIHWCNTPGCFTCPTLDAGGTTARRYARRLWKQIGTGTNRRLSPTEHELALLARTLHRLAEGLA